MSMRPLLMMILLSLFQKVLTANISSSNLVLFVEPYGKIDPVVMYETRRIGFSIRHKECLYEGIHCANKHVKDINLTFELTDDESWALELKTKSISMTTDDILRGTSKDIIVFGAIVGFNRLEVYAEEAPNKKLGVESKSKNNSLEPYRSTNGRAMIGSFELVVIKTNTIVDKVYATVMTFAVLFANINMGVHMDFQILKTVLLKPIGPLVGFVCQFLLMPCISYGIGYLLFDDVLSRFGFFAMGCCPGGLYSNFWCLMLGGDVNLSVTMTTVSTISALGMMPMWMYFLGSKIVDGEDIEIPFARIIIALIFLIGPIGIGLIVKYQSEYGRRILQKLTMPFVIVVQLFNMTLGTYTYRTSFALLSGRIVAAAFMIAYLGFGLGAFFAWMFRLNASQIIAISFETSMQNGLLCLVMLFLTFDTPHGDIASIAPIAQSMLTILPLWVVYAFKIAFEKYYKKHVEDSNEEDSKHNQEKAETQAIDVEERI